MLNGANSDTKIPEGKRIETNAPDQSHYSRFKNQRDHIFHAPGMYLGAVAKDPREFYLFDIQNKKFVRSMVELPPAMERLFLEALSNAADNVERSRLCKVDPGVISIQMDRQWIILRNEGVPIPVTLKDDEPIWIPHMVFCVLLSSSNYDPKKVRYVFGE